MAVLYGVGLATVDEVIRTMWCGSLREGGRLVSGSTQVCPRLPVAFVPGAGSLERPQTNVDATLLRPDSDHLGHLGAFLFRLVRACRKMQAAFLPAGWLTVGLEPTSACLQGAGRLSANVLSHPVKAGFG